jgi:alpha-galactosidase/6-phospho-beta-glucosidase family protein
MCLKMYRMFTESVNMCINLCHVEIGGLNLIIWECQPDFSDSWPAGLCLNHITWTVKVKRQGLKYLNI